MNRKDRDRGTEYHLTAKMLRSPADTESLVTAGGREVGDGRTQTLAVASRVAPAQRTHPPRLMATIVV